MDPVRLEGWITAYTGLISAGIMIEQEFVKLFKLHSADMTPEQQRAALMEIRDEAARRKALAEGEVAKVEAKIAAETPEPPVG